MIRAGSSEYEAQETLPLFTKADRNKVSSTETPMMRTGESFPYPLDASRQFQARSSSMFHPINPPVPSNYVEGMPMAAGPDGLQYRNGSAFGYGGRQYYPMQGFANGYPEQTAAVEYIGYPASYQSVQDPNYMVNCRMGANTPQAREDPGTPYVQPKPEPGTPLYVDTDAASYGYVPSSAAPSMAARQPSSAESGSFSFQNVAAGLSNSLDSGDRMLPAPAPARRPLPTAAPRSYRAASVSSSGHSKNSQRSNDGTSPPSPTNGSSGNYGPYSSSPADSYHASSLNTLNSGMSRGNELYTTAGSEMVQGSDNGVRMSGGGNMTYQYHDTTTRRGTASQPHGMALGGSQSYLSQNPGHSSGPFMMAGTETSQGPTDGNERKPLGGVRSYPYEIKPLVFGDKPEWK